MMYFLLLSSLLVARAVCTHHHHQNHPGRRVCGRDQLHSNAVVLHTESFVQPIHKPYIALCQGHRLCSTYRTEYRVAYRQVSRIAPSSLNSYPQCCPGWRRLHSHGCNQALCDNPCINGGTCVRPNQCACAPGWTGRRCQTDVDECSGSHHCSQLCLNTAGSYLCECREGHQLTEDRRSCHHPPSPPLPTPSAQAETDHLRSTSHSGGGAGATNNVTEEVRDLKSRVEMLEEKLNQALAPFNSLFPLSMEEGEAEKTSFLTHSFQQLDRIESLSEQIGFLEGRLETCSCQDN